MRKVTKFVFLTAMIALLFSVSVFAKEAIPCQHLDSYTTNSFAYRPGDITTYRCLNTGCRAYLIYRKPMSTCIYCSSKSHAYECSQCGMWYCICESGDYNPAVGH